MKVILPFLVLFPFFAFCQYRNQPSASEIKNEIDHLSQTGSVLYVAAHPDDENTRLISYLVKARGYRTGYLSLTRGDGGQNLIGNEQGPALGLIRTHELLQARKIDGGEQFFTRAYDFGFSKNPEETFRMWNREVLLSDVVKVIREFRPDVIICRFPATGEGGHGHHTASAILAEEAFRAAADPSQFKEQLVRGVSTWQAKRLLWNTFQFGATNTTAENQFKINVGGYNILLGKSYGEIASQSRSKHGSQGFGSYLTRTNQFEYFKLLAGESLQKSLLNGVDTTWGRYPNARAIADSIDKLRRQYSFNAPSASTKLLVGILVNIQKSKLDSATKQKKIEKVKKLIAACLGLHLEAFSSKPTTVVGDSLAFTLSIVNRSTKPVQFKYAALGNTELAIMETVLETGVALTQNHKVKMISTVNPVTLPYWLEQPVENAFFKANSYDFSRPLQKPPAHLSVMLNVAGEDITFELPVEYKGLNPAKGEIYQPLQIIPPVLIYPSDKVLALINKQKQSSVKLTFEKSDVAGKLHISAPKGFKVHPSEFPFSSKGNSTDTTFTYTVFNIGAALDTVSATLTFQVTTASGTYSFTSSKLGYEHIPEQLIFSLAKVKVFALDERLKPVKIAFLPGSGDYTVEALSQLELSVDVLTENQILSQSLINVYPTLVLGVRAFNTVKNLAKAEGVLNRYVEQGGNLVVQYNTSHGLVTDQIGPYPLKITRDRITDERARVNFFEPGNVLLNKPLAITSNDFRGWIQERGLYYVSDPTGKYQKPLVMHDANESETSGGLLTVAYGKGRFTYTSLSLFRQLPEGVPGAYRLLYNLVTQTSDSKRR